MKKNVIMVVVAGLMGFVLASFMYSGKRQVQSASPSYSAVSTSAKALPQDNSPVVVRFSGQTLTKNALIEKINQLYANTPAANRPNFDQMDKSTKENLIRNIVTGVLLEGEANKARVQDTTEYQNLMKEVVTQLSQKVFVEQKIKAFVTEDKLKAQYEQMKQDMGNKEEIRVRHILVEKEDVAKSLVEQLKQGVSFEELAKANSLDNNKDTGGDLGYFSQGRMVKPFEEAAFALKPGEISAPVKTDFGWHIIKMEDKRKAQVPSYEESKPNLERDMAIKFVGEYTGELLKNANLEIVDSVPVEDKK